MNCNLINKARKLNTAFTVDYFAKNVNFIIIYFLIIIPVYKKDEKEDKVAERQQTVAQPGQTPGKGCPQIKFIYIGYECLS
jgi:hypothetical protein